MDWWVASSIALVALLVSTYALVSSRRDKQRRIKVELSKGFLPTDVDPLKTMLFIQVFNPGHIPVTLQRPGIQLPDKRTWFPSSQPGGPRFLHELRPGQACTVWFPLAVFANQLKGEGFSGKVKLRGFCKDAMGTVHKGKRWKLNVDARSGPGPSGRTRKGKP